MPTPPSVATVILNWNGRKYLEQFLPFVLRTTYTHHRLIVADNASSDDSLAFLAERYPEVEVIRLPRNYGFAGGYNEALKRVEADYYLLLNSDVEVEPGWLEPMVALLESDPQKAACQPTIRAWHNRQLFEYAGAAGGWIDSLGYPFSRGRLFETCEEDHGQYTTNQEVFWASGAALLIRSQVYRQLGGFDPYFFAHMEEIDLCWRIQLAGYKVMACPQSVVYHVGGGTLPKGNSRKTFLNFRNNHIMLWKNLSWKEKWWKVPSRLGLDQIAALKALAGGDSGYFVAVIKAHLHFIRWVIAGKKTPALFPLRPLKSLSGVYPGLVIIDYFLRKKKSFREVTGSGQEKGS